MTGRDRALQAGLGTDAKGRSKIGTGTIGSGTDGDFHAYFEVAGFGPGDFFVFESEVVIPTDPRPKGRGSGWISQLV